MQTTDPRRQAQPITREPRPDVDPRHLSPGGPPHPDPATERAIIRWDLGYHVGEPCLFGSGPL